MPFVNSTFFLVLFTMFLANHDWFETKNKIRCIDAPKYAFTHRNLPESEKYIWIIQNVHEKYWFFYIISITYAIIESRATRHSAVSALYGDSRVSRAQPRINAYKKRLDASVKERPQTLLVPSEEICKRVLCNKHI